ncbi:MAG: enoyl-CoA hydratase-related protein [Candidatus Thiodiazotropha sp.]
MKFETVVLNIENQIATITLNRPEHLNAGNRQMIDDLLTAFDLCDEDDEVKAIVVTGEGRAFCAGADISGGSSGFLDSEASESANTSSLPPRDIGGLITLRIYDLKKPIIAAINGAAAGMGVTMTLPMDFRLASNTAKLGFVFAKRGIVPESNSSYFLQKTVGITQALDLYDRPNCQCSGSAGKRFSQSTLHPGKFASRRL